MEDYVHFSLVLKLVDIWALLRVLIKFNLEETRKKLSQCYDI